MTRAVIAMALLGCAGCPSSPGTPPPVETGAAPTASSVDGAEPVDERPPPKTVEKKDDVKTLFVDAELVDCEGEGPMKCLRIRESESEDWTLLYQGIEGFTHEAGTVYELRVEVSDVSDPPADASSRRLRLIEIVSQKPAEKSP